MLVAWVFWLLLLAPGVCVLDWLRRGAERGCVLESIGLGYALSFALIVPLSTAGYALELPLWVLSGAIVLLVALALVRLGTRVWRRRSRPAFEPWTAVAVATLLLLLLHAAAVGGHLVNDADFHIARVRSLYEHGLSNHDPYTETGFTHPYHSNVVHAVLAAGAQLTGTDPLEFWQATLPFAKLVAACGVATLCLQLGGTALAAWLTALFALGSMFVLDWTLYPNQLAVWWLVPVGLAATLGLLTSTAMRLHVVVLASCSLVLAVTHGLYAGYLGVLSACMVAPVVAHRLINHAGQRRHWLALGALAALALSPPLPFLYVARTTHVPHQANFDYLGGAPTPRPSKPERFTRHLRTDANGRFSVPPNELYGGATKRVLGVLSLIALLRRRRYVAFTAIVSSLGVSMLMLSVPLLASAAIHVVGAAWTLERLTALVGMQHVALVGGALVPIVAENVAGRVWPTLVPLLACAVGIVSGSGGPALAASAVVENLWETDPPSLTGSRLPRWMAEDRELLRMLPPGSTVLTHPMGARQLRKLYDLKFIRASRNHSGVDDLVDRTVAMHDLIYAKRLTPALSKVLARFDVHFAVQSEEHPIKWLDAQPVLGQTLRLKIVQVGTKAR